MSSTVSIIVLWPNFSAVIGNQDKVHSCVKRLMPCFRETFNITVFSLALCIEVNFIHSECELFHSTTMRTMQLDTGNEIETITKT